MSKEGKWLSPKRPRPHGLCQTPHLHESRERNARMGDRWKCKCGQVFRVTATLIDHNGNLMQVTWRRV